VTKDGTVKLGDFGFIQSVWDAELMQEGTTIGTPDYISPEQARGERNLDVRSDIYSLGASLFHMLTGKTLFQGSCSKVMRDHIETEPPKLDELRKDLPKDLKRMLGKMTAKQPIDRYQTPDEVIKDLDLLRIDVAHKDGAIPSSRSQIMNVITAEKERIATLEKVIAAKSQQITALLVLMGLGWILAAASFAMWMINAK
jgi:serine/threonine protein kinase